MKSADLIRVEKINEYDVLGEAQRDDLQGITTLAAQLAAVPMASINVITRDEQHMIATHGFDAAVCARSDSMCNQVMGAELPVIVPDAVIDPRFVNNPWVTGVLGNVRLYASQTLRSPAGTVFGTLCVFDNEPRELSDSQIQGLVLLADRVVDALELSLRGRQMAASNSLLRDFASQVSHDLKTPLTSVGLCLGLINEQLADGAPVEGTRQLVDRALASTTRMGTFIDRHLDFAARPETLHADQVDLNDTLDEVCMDLAGALREVSVSREALPTVVGDAVQLRAVLQNLLHNASKFRHASRPPTILVRAVRTRNAWRIEVVDNGSGIEESDRERVFGAHERAHQSVAGSGLGLDTARRAIAAHGGRIGLAANPGGGTIAWFELTD